MDQNVKIKRVASEAASCDFSRIIKDSGRAVTKHFLELLEGKKRRLQAEISEKMLKSIENKAHIELLKVKNMSKQAHCEMLWRYNGELVKQIANERDRREKLVKRYEDMIKDVTHTWENFLEIYNRFPLARKRTELVNKFKLVKFQARYEAQRREDLEQTIAKMNEMLSLIREARLKEKARLTANLEENKVRIEELNRITKEKEELLIRLKAEKAEKERAKQRSSEIRSDGFVNLSFPMMVPPMPSQLTLQNYGFASQPVSAFSHKSQLPRAQIPPPPPSQSSVVMSFNRREIHSRIIEERCFVVVPATPATTASSAPMINYNTALENNGTEDVDMADNFAPSRHETNTGEQVDLTANHTIARLVDTGYGGSDNSQSPVRDIFSLSEGPCPSPEFSPFKCPTQNSQSRDQISSSTVPVVLSSNSSSFPQSTEACIYAVSSTQTSQLPQFSNENFQSSSAQTLLARSLSQSSVSKTTTEAAFVNSGPPSAPQIRPAVASPSPTVPGHVSAVLAPQATRAEAAQLASCSQTPGKVPSSSKPLSQRYHPYPSVPVTNQARNPSAVASPRQVPGRTLSAFSTFVPQAPRYLAPQPTPPETPAAALQHPMTAERSIPSPLPVRPVPAMSPTLQTPANNMPPFSSQVSTPPQGQSLVGSQQSTDIRDTQTDSQAEGERSHYFNASSSVANQEAVLASPEKGGPEIINETHSDPGSKTSGSFQDIQDPDPGYENSELSDECPRFLEEDVGSSPHRFLTSPTSPPLPDTQTGFGATNFSFTSFFRNPFGGQSSSNNAVANGDASGQANGAFSFNSAPSSNPFKLF